MTRDDHRTKYYTERDSGRQDALTTSAVIAPSLVNDSEELPVVRSVTPKPNGDLTIPIKLVKRLYNAGVSDSKIQGTEVIVRLTSTAGAKNSSTTCHYCGEELNMAHRNKIVLTSQNINRSFHTGCYEEFLEKLGRILQENKADLAAYNI